MRFLVLGTLEVTGDDGPILLTGSKRRALLGRLLVGNGAASPIDRLVDDIWGEDANDGARRTVQTYVSQLRRLLGERAITTRGGGYALEIEKMSIDANVMVALLARASTVDPTTRIDLLEEALGLWRGEPLEEFSGQQWADEFSREMSQHHLVGCERRIDTLLELERADDALPELERLTNSHPLDERFRAQQMLALYRTGRQVDALAVARELRRSLREELGIDPTSGIVELEQRILEQDTSLMTPIPHAGGARSQRVQVTPDDLPSGTTTFMLTDVVDSTELWDSSPDLMAEALRLHDERIAEIVASFDGQFVKSRGEGDSTFSVFARATNALDAAIAVQTGPKAATHDVDLNLSLRIGLHTGEAQLRGGDYYGGAVNRAARIRTLAGPGSIVVSRATHDLVVDTLPGGTELVEIGAHQLKGLRRSETVYAVVRDGIARPESEPQPITGPAIERFAIPARLTVPGTGFVGRHAEIAAIDSATAADGPQLVLVGGEPGVGKSSLVAVAALRMHADGAVVLHGQADEYLGVPYQPWRDALGLLVDSLPAGVLDAHVRDHGTLLATIVPELGRRTRHHEAGADDGEHGRYELMASVVALLGAASADAPMVVVLDDLQWADDGSIELLRYLLASPRPMAVRVLATYRTSETTAALDALIGDLHRHPRGHLLELAGLEDSDLADFVATRVTGPMADQAALTELLRETTGGNPFFASEVLRAREEHPDGEPALPSSAVDAVIRRAARLGPVVVQVLRTAAVVGLRFDLPALLASTDHDEDTVFDALDTAIRTGLVSELGPERFAFAHAFIEQALTHDMGPTRRSRAHRRVAEAIEHLTMDDLDARAAEVAHHHVLGGSKQSDTEAACRRAGDAALRTFSPTEAARWYEAALAAHPERDRWHAELMVRLATAQRAARGPARATAEEAAALARSLGEPDLVADALLSTNRWFGSNSGEVEEERVQSMRSALADLDPRPSERRASLLMALAGELMYASVPDEVDALVDDALRMVDQLADEDLELAFLSRAAGVLQQPQSFDRCLALSRRAIELSLARPGSDVPIGITPFVIAGDLETAARLLANAERAAEEYREPVVVWTAAVAAALWASVAGDADGLDRLTTEAFALGTEAQQPDALTFYGGQLVFARRMQGRLGEVIELLDAMMVEHPGAESFRAARALAAVETGDVDRAAAYLATRDWIDTPRDLTWMATMGMIAETAARVANREASTALIDLLSPHDGQFIVPGIVALTGSVTALLGALHGAIGSSEEADRRFTQAVATCDRLGMAFEAANARTLWVEVLWRDGRSPELVRELGDQVTAAAAAAGYSGLERRVRVCRAR